jgi:hypothetical protein
MTEGRNDPLAGIHIIDCDAQSVDLWTSTAGAKFKDRAPGETS